MCLYAYACVHRHTYIHAYIISLYTHIYAPPTSVLQRCDSRNCLIYAFNGKSRVWRRDNNANQKSKLHFQAVCPGVEAQPKGEEEKYVQPFQTVSVWASKAWCGEGREGTACFQSFPRESGISLRRKGDYLAPPPPPPQRPFLPLLPLRLPLRAFGIPGLAARADISLQTFFYWAVLCQGRARESLRSCWARGGGRVLTPACKHTLPPPLHRDRVHYFFTLLSIFILFYFLFVSSPSPSPSSPCPLVRLWYNLLKERTSFNLGSLVSFTGEWNEVGKNAIFQSVFPPTPPLR